MDAVSQLVSLIAKDGPTIVFACAFAAVIVVLFKLYKEARDREAAEIKDGRDREAKALREQVDSERTQKEAALARLDSNTTALREATVGFNAAVDILSDLADRDERAGAVPPSRRTDSRNGR